MLKQRLVNRRNHQEDTLQCLVDMGFTRELANMALHVNNGVYSTALEWLIQNKRDDEPVVVPMQRSLSSISPSTIVTDNVSYGRTCNSLYSLAKAFFCLGNC